jgi:predicted regulator of Ras-like GTPase activity (Roadblock/LC7/MglB family)
VHALLQSDVDETIKRLSTRKGVEGIVILNNEGLTVRSTIDAELTKKYALYIHQLVGNSRAAVSGIDPEVPCFEYSHVMKNSKWVFAVTSSYPYQSRTN